jgi:hypothetical protein
MTSDFCLISHSPQRDANEFPSHRPGNGLTKRRLPHPWRTHEAENGSFHAGLQLSNGEILEDPFLHFLEVEMILVENFLGIGDIEVVFRRF